MTKRLEIMLIVLVAVIIVGAIVFSQTSTRRETVDIGTQIPPAQSDEFVDTKVDIEFGALPAATENSDTAIDAFLLQAEEESMVLGSEFSDADLMNLDSQALATYGDSYDASEF